MKSCYIHVHAKIVSQICSSQVSNALNLRKCLPKETFLLPDDDDAVEAELERQQEHRTSSGVTTGKSSDKSQSWVKMHMNLASKRHLIYVSVRIIV